MSGNSTFRPMGREKGRGVAGERKGGRGKVEKEREGGGQGTEEGGILWGGLCSGNFFARAILIFLGGNHQ